MPWTYSQSTGALTDPDGFQLATGYSGSGPDKNQPEDQAVKNMGPIPRGGYTIGAPYDTADHGPFVMVLTADAEDEEFGRNGFLIHGDNIHEPGTASHGCIILPSFARHRIAESADDRLEVIV